MTGRLAAVAGTVAVVLSIAWAVHRALGRPVPRSLWPLLITACLLGHAAFDEYRWRSRTLAALPDGIVVAGEGVHRSPLSPWSYLLAPVSRLSLIDRREVLPHPDRAEMRLVEIALLARGRPDVRVREVVDCERDRGAALRGDPGFGPDGLPVGVRWFSLDADDPRLEIVCPGA